MALNPQLTKSYATGDYTHMHQLLKVSSKFSFYLMLLISLPLMLEAPLILKWWLGIVPEHTVSFLRMILCTGLLLALSNPIIVSVHATGKLKRFQLIEGTMLLSIVPIAYLLLKLFHIPPEYVFLVHIIVEICTQYARVRIVLPMITMSIRDYAVNVIIPILKVSMLALTIPLLVYCNVDKNIMSFFIVCLITTCWILLITYFIGCTKDEQLFVKNKFAVILNKLKK